MPEHASDPFEVNHLISVVAKGHGLAGIAQHLSRLLAKNILITDHTFHILASSADINDLQIHVEMLVEREATSELGAFFECIIKNNDIDQKAIGFHIHLTNNAGGYLFLVGDSMNKKELQLLSQAVLLCQIEFQKQQAITTVKQNYKDAFVFDLLYGNIKNEEDIIVQGKIWNMDFTQPHLVIVFSLKDYELYSSDSQIMDKINQFIKQALNIHHIHSLTMKKRDEIVLIFPFDNHEMSKNRYDIEEFIAWVINKSEKIGIKNRILPGIGRGYNESVELFRSYQEAKIARELGQLMNITYPFFSDLGFVHILYNHDLQELKEYYKETIGPLEAYDKKNESNLMETLTTYMNNQCDLGKSAEALFLHRNSLRYRLKKIEEILNIQLNELETRLNLMAALKIKQIKKL